MKINQLNGPSPIHDTSTWLSQSIQSIRHVCCWLSTQKNLPWKCFTIAFGHYDFRSTSASQQAWPIRKRYHLLFQNAGLNWRKNPLRARVSGNRCNLLFCIVINSTQDCLKANTDPKYWNRKYWKYSTFNIFCTQISKRLHFGINILDAPR